MTGQINVNKIAARTGNAITIESGDVLQAPGHVLQVQSMTVTTSATSAAGTTFNDTGLTIDITPSSTSSKIYVMSHVSMGATNGYRFALRLVRGSTDVYVGDAAGSRTQATGQFHETSGDQYDIAQVAGTHMDSPATTSSVTYKMMVGTPYSSSYVLDVNHQGDDSDQSWVGRTASTITVMEVSG